MRIAPKVMVVAPSRSADSALPAALAPLAAAEGVELAVHPQCFLRDGHFAGADAARATAFVEAANDPEVDAVWFARGGYGAARILEAVLPELGPAARSKTYLGYSDGGAILAALHGAGFAGCVHGPVAQDALRQDGAAARRALAWLARRDPAALEPSLEDGPPALAFNLTVLAHLLGTPWEPDPRGRVLMVEEVAEPVYRIDRALHQVAVWAAARGALGLRLGRCSEIVPNDPEFGREPEALAEEWCRRTGLPWLGAADIGHDGANKIVPFGPA